MKRYLLVITIIFICLTGKSQYKNDILIEQVLKTDTTTTGQKITYPSFIDNEVTMLKITIPPGASTGWHKHEIPVFAYMVEGTLTVEYENHKPVVFTKNSSIAEVKGTYHNGTNKGSENAVLIAIYLGEKGKLNSIKKE
jgi:quercetin dioxygenase-like cupin family protein